MMVLGLLLMLGCTALAVDAVVQNTSSVQAIAFDQSISGLTLGGVFVAGAVLGLLFALGLAMFASGIGRAARLRRERRALAKDNADAESLRAENARLEQELAAERDSAAYPSDTAADSTASTTTGGRHRLNT
jgi:uncharacterized protein HemX